MTHSRRPTDSNHHATACTTKYQPVVQAGDYTIRDAMHAAVDALGGNKAVGSTLWPELHPETAGARLAHCMESGRRERLSLDQIALIFRRAHQQGAHAGMARLCAAFGYAPAAPISETDVIADLHRQAMAAAQRASELSAEAMERMRAAGINVGALK